MDSKLVVTTSWDDGNKLDLKLADLLKKYALPGTFYIAPQNREFKRHELLTSDEILQVSNDFEIGGHTLTHPSLTEIPLPEAAREIASGKQYLEALINQPITSFCYPKGKYNQDIQSIVRQTGFQLARTIERYVFTLSSDLYAVGTSLHAFQHYSDLIKTAQFFNWQWPQIIRNFRWDDLAMSMFDQLLGQPAVFHLWGHSWEIDEYNNWAKLERVFQHIHRHPDVLYLNNAQAINHFQANAEFTNHLKEVNH